MEYEILKDKICKLCKKTKKNYDFFPKSRYCKPCYNEKRPKVKNPNFDQNKFSKSQRTWK